MDITQAVAKASKISDKVLQNLNTNLVIQALKWFLFHSAFLPQSKVVPLKYPINDTECEHSI
jgi:hypothetical protein